MRSFRSCTSPQNFIATAISPSDQECDKEAAAYAAASLLLLQSRKKLGASAHLFTKHSKITLAGRRSDAFKLAHFNANYRFIFFS